MNMTHPKACLICGEDCSDRPRIKDPNGRYYCKACYDGELARRRSAQRTDRHEIEVGLLSGGLEPCPGCDDLMASDAVVCHHCGYHQGLKRKVVCETEPTEAESPAATPGTMPGFHRAARPDQLARDSRQVARQAYLTPIIMFIVGAGLFATIQWAAAGPTAPVIYLLSFLVSVPIGLAVYWGCCLLWIGFDAPLILTTFRLAGIYAVADTLLLIPVVGWLISSIIYLALLIQVLELEMIDAAAVAVATFFVKTVLFIAVVTWLVSHVG